MTARTAACVKACEGISTEALTTYGAHDLPDFALIDALLAECKRLRHELECSDLRKIVAQRDAQREQIQALRKALEKIQRGPADPLPLPSGESWKRYSIALDAMQHIARAALAKVSP